MKILSKKSGDLIIIATISVLATACNKNSKDNINTVVLPNSVTIKSVSQNPEGIEYDKSDHPFLLSSFTCRPHN